jgi:hypothetical protein
MKVLLVILILLASFSVEAQEVAVAEDHLISCKYLHDFTALQRMAAVGDQVAVDRMVRRKMGDGVCVSFDCGTPVFIVKATKGLILVRQRGGTTEYWTSPATVGGGEEGAVRKSY